MIFPGIMEPVGAIVLVAVVVWALHRLTRPVVLIQQHIASILASCGGIAEGVAAIPELEETELFTGAGYPGIVRYADGLRRAL